MISRPRQIRAGSTGFFGGSPGARGFTLIEIVLVLALMALMVTVTLTGARLISDASGEVDAESAVKSAITAARRAAVGTNSVVTLHLKDDTLTWDGGSQALPAGNTHVHFLPPERASLSLVGGQIAEESIPLVRFYPDGTCDAFRVEFKGKEGAKIENIDPWTGAELQPASGGAP